MSKKAFTRSNMRENMLKKVLIRVDYNGVTDIDKWILKLKKDNSLSSHFKSYNQELQSRTSFDLSNLGDFEVSNSYPSSRIKEPLHKFYEGNFKDREDAVLMEVSGYFLVFTITCKNYINLDIYIEFLSEYFEKFLKFDKYIDIKRIGIRKVGGDEFDSIEGVGKTFEKIIFGLNIKGIPKKKFELEYVDRFFDEEQNIKVNFSRRCRTINVKGKGSIYQALIDLDGYVDSSVMTHADFDNPNCFKQLITNINNYLFELYKISVTEQFLKTKSNA